jgi:dTDP-4-dehydrorhamnose reductase
MIILGTGLSGLIGSRLMELQTDWAYENLSKEVGVDITNSDELRKSIQTSSAQWIFHFAAYTDVDGAEKMKNEGKSSLVWKINVEATQVIVEEAKRSGKNVLYLSTDYVFNGTDESYTEQSMPKPESFYALSKYEGEEAIKQLGDAGLIVRTANPYRNKPVGKLDFVHKIKQLLITHATILAPNDQIFVPTFIDDLVNGIRILVSAQKSGIYHVVGDDALTPFDAAIAIARRYNLSENTITPTSFAKYSEGKAARPRQANIKHDRITREFGFEPRTFQEGLKLIE